jgi:hypothetical protein
MVPRTELAARLIVICAVGFAIFASPAVLFAQDNPLKAALDNLVAAYPNALTGHDDKVLRWRDGTEMLLSDGNDNKPFAEQLQHASINDQMLMAYPRGTFDKPPSTNSDPGRLRNAAFFTKMYGDCTKGEVSPRLVSLNWLPKSWGKPIRITTVNGVDQQLRAVSAEIDTLPDAIKRTAYPIAGTYNCRAVADTGAPSPHGYGIAIDLNTRYSDYWFWQPHDESRGLPIAYRNRMPQEIVAIFEKHGFIWGGKWYHFDTMHFEYRPELLTGG